jgi:hypothetical protein
VATRQHAVAAQLKALVADAKLIDEALVAQQQHSTRTRSAELNNKQPHTVATMREEIRELELELAEKHALIAACKQSFGAWRTRFDVLRTDSHAALADTEGAKF